MEQSRAGTAVLRRRFPGRLLLPVLGAIVLVLLSPERAHAADRPAPATAATPKGAAMPADIADTPAARLLAAVRSIPLARLLAVTKSLQGEGTAVLSISFHHGTRTAVLFPSPLHDRDLAARAPQPTAVAPTGAGSAQLERLGTRTRSYKPLVSPG